MVLRLASGLIETSYGTAAAAAEAADLVRGYEDVKLASIERYRARLPELGLCDAVPSASSLRKRRCTERKLR
jgi:indolepyruvate ferredoxin oxidoreductase